jgi:hypothetical protein
MRGRKPDKFVLRARDAAALHDLLRDGQTPLKVARRAQILLSRAEARQRVALVGSKVGQDEATIWRVCERYRQGGLRAALYDAPRSGRPRVFPRRRAPRH